MNFRKENPRDNFLFDTDVENIFITEYMPPAPGEHVKVYLFSLMYAQLGQEMDNGTVAQQLSLSEEDVLKAWSYWEELGVIRKHRKNPENKFDYEVEFVNLKELLYGKANKPAAKPAAPEAVRSDMEDETAKTLFRSIERIIGSVISKVEMEEVLSWMNEFHAAPEIIVYAYSYCKEKGKQNTRYVGAVVKKWVSEGLNDVVAVEDYLQNNDQRHYLYRRICKALGFARNLTEEEEKLADGWFDRMNYTIDKVLEACSLTSGISNPNIRYVNKVLVNWYEEQQQAPEGSAKPVSMTVVNQYYKYLQTSAEEEAEERRKKVYRAVPAIAEIEEEMGRLNMEISRMIISQRSDKEAQMNKIQSRMDYLTQEKAFLLTENNFELDYMDVKYRCSLCKDTGIDDDGGRCECVKQRTKEAESWQRSKSEE